MKHLKTLGLAALAAMALTGFIGAGTASATTLEVGGVTRNESITIYASLKPGTSTKLESTLGIGAKTCTSSHMHGSTEAPYTGTYVTAPLTPGHDVGLTFSGCDHTVTVHNPGKLYIDWEEGTTNGKVYSEELDITTYSTIHGTHITCSTGAGTLIGTLTGTSAGHAELHVNAVLLGGDHITSCRWTGTYTVTTPTGLGVSA